MVKFQYRPRTMEDVKRQAEQSSGNFDRIFKADYDLFTPKDGENVIRFCPPTWEDAHHYAYEIYVHFNVGPRNGTYLCPKKMLNKACPICDAADDALRHGEKDDAARMGAKKRYVAWVLNRNSDTPKLPMLWSHGWTTDKDINASLTDRRRGEVLQIDHPEEGYDIIFQRTSGKEPWNTKYSGIKTDRESTPMLERAKDIDVVMDYIEANPVPDTLKFYPSEYLEDLIAGAAGEDDESKDDDTEDTDVKKTTTRGKSARDDRDDDERDVRRGSVRGRARDDDDADERPVRGRAKDDDDAPVDEPPARGRGRVAKDVDEEDDVPPVRGRGRKADVDDDEELPKGKSRAAADDDDDLPYDVADDPEAESDNEAEEAARDVARTARGQPRNGGAREARTEREEETRPTRRPTPRDSRSTKATGRASRR